MKMQVQNMTKITSLCKFKHLFIYFYTLSINCLVITKNFKNKDVTKTRFLSFKI